MKTKENKWVFEKHSKNSKPEKTQMIETQNKQWKAKKTMVLAIFMNLLPNPENPRKAKFDSSLITNWIETKQPQAKTPPKPELLQL